MARREGLEAHAGVGQRLELRGDAHGAVRAPPDVQRNDAHVVARREERPVARVVQDKPEHALELVERIFQTFIGVLEVQRQDALAVGARLEREGAAEPGRDLGVVVDLAVDGERDRGRAAAAFRRRHLRGERLRAGLGVHDGQALVRDGAFVHHPHARPVRPAVPQPLRQLHDQLAQLGLREVGVEDAHDAAHFGAARGGGGGGGGGGERGEGEDGRGNRKKVT